MVNVRVENRLEKRLRTPEMSGLGVEVAEFRKMQNTEESPQRAKKQAVFCR